MKSAPVPHAAPTHRKVVDAFTRSLHALMALSFAGAYLTSDTDALRLVHVTCGYTLAGVFVIRVLWGLFGPRRVRLWPLATRLAGATQAVALVRQRDVAALAKQVLALSMVMLLLCTLPVIASGYLTYFDVLGEWTEDLHESMANLMLTAALGHVAMVMLLAWILPGRQIRPMLSGRLPGQGPHLVQHNLGALALALVLGVAGFWGWQAWQYTVDPEFRHPPRWLHPVGGPRLHDDD